MEQWKNAENKDNILSICFAFAEKLGGEIKFVLGYLLSNKKTFRYVTEKIKYINKYIINNSLSVAILQINSYIVLRFEVLTAVTMKNGVFWVITPCGSWKNRRFGGT
jgi:hypothetical protein